MISTSIRPACTNERRTMAISRACAHHLRLISADVGRRRDGIAVVIPRANVEVVWRGLQIDAGIQPGRSGQEAIRRRARLRAVMLHRVPSACAAAARLGHVGFTFLPAPAISVPGSIRVRFCAASFAAMGARHEPAPAEFPPADEEAY